MFCTIKFVYYKSFCVRDDIGSYIRTVYHMVSHTPKRQAVGSNPAGITILPTRFDRFALKKATVKLVGFFFFRTLPNTKNLLTEGGPVSRFLIFQPDF